MSTSFRLNAAGQLCVFPAALLLWGAISLPAVAVQDMMLQTKDGKIVTGLVDDVSGVGTLGTRVYGRQFLLVSGGFRASNPGFYSLRTGDPEMPAGAAGFPSQHDVNFDLLPMTIGAVSSNLFYWDGSDTNGGAIDESDVNFALPSAGVSWTQYDDNFSPFIASGTNQLVSGGLIDQTTDDVWPDAFDSGTLHAHLAMLVNDNDNNSSTQPSAGVYMIAYQARSVGFQTSDPFFLVMRSPTTTDAVRDAAVAWVEDQLTLPGDYNKNGVVDAADYVLWRKTSGQSGMGLAADGDDNQQVDSGDYTYWRQRFQNASGLTVSNSIGTGSSTALGALAVPEPGLAQLISILLTWLVSFFRIRVPHRYIRSYSDNRV